MSPRLRALVGSIALVVFLAVYVWLATLVAAHLPDNRWAWLIFYPVVGLAWGIPVLPLLSWINKGR